MRDNRKQEETEEKIAKYTIKDSVFSDLFKMKKYLLQLYQALHPEDTTATEDELTDITLRNVLTDNLYNDLGFSYGEKIFILTAFQCPTLILTFARTDARKRLSTSVRNTAKKIMATFALVPIPKVAITIGIRAIGGIVRKNWIHGSTITRNPSYHPKRNATGIDKKNPKRKPPITRNKLSRMWIQSVPDERFVTKASHTWAGDTITLPISGMDETAHQAITAVAMETARQSIWYSPLWCSFNLFIISLLFLGFLLFLNRNRFLYSYRKRFLYE